MNTYKQFIGSLALGAVLATSVAVPSFAQDGWRNDRWERNERRDDRWDNRDNHRNYAYARAQFEKGYRDGLDRGRKDAQTNRRRDPNNSSHYQKGNQFYRQGFEKGFYEAYQQLRRNNRGRRGW
jgi:hypothetical protein